MAINFPNTPATNDLFTSGSKTWKYNGTVWVLTTATTITRAQATLTVPGVLTTGVGQARLYFDTAQTISNVVAGVGTAPAGQSIIVDVNLNGTTIFTTQANRPTITAGTNADTTSTPNVTAIAVGNYLTVDVDQIGTTTAGSDLVVTIFYT